MYTHNNTAFSRAADSLRHFPSPMQSAAATDPQYHQNQLTPGEFDSAQHESVWRLNSEVMNNNNSYYYSSSGCSSYTGSPSSLASYETHRTATTLMQRSISSHSLLHKNHHHNNNNNSNNNNNNGSHHQYQISALFAELLQSDNGPVRRVYSTGDLQRINGMHHYHQSESPLSSESSMIIEAMSRASPYSPEEKKVRIERYRSKRNQRNFTKKIKYACRKTLADSRPRIRGRFARNDEIAMMMNNAPSSEVDQWNHQFGAAAGDELEEYEDDENWSNFFDSLDPALNLAADQTQDSSSFGFY